MELDCFMQFISSYIHSSWMFTVVQNQQTPLRRTLGGRQGGLGRRPNGAAVARTKPRTGRGRCDVRDALDGDFSWQNLTDAKRREFSGMIHWLTTNNHPSNPQQPIHSLRLAPRNRGKT
jgi:hypothetical protein